MTVGEIGSQFFFTEDKEEVLIMRSTPIIETLRKYGVNSKRLNPRCKIKYEDAIKAIKAYESADMKIAEVVDNVLEPKKSVSCHCQLPGCGMKIRYEYILENKISKERLVAGSTCVWPTLGFSELQKKEFRSFEKVIKDHSELVEWSNDNPDIIDKLKRLKDEKFFYYRAFWEEIEFCRLTDTDTDFIRNVDVDKLIEDREAKKRRIAEEKRKREEYLKASAEKRAEIDREYNEVLNALNTLFNNNPTNRFYKSLKLTVDSGRKLSETQMRCIKIDANKAWYRSKIKDTNLDIMSKVDSVINPILSSEGITFKTRDFGDKVSKIDTLIKGMDSKFHSLAWTLFKVKYELVA